MTRTRRRRSLAVSLLVFSSTAACVPSSTGPNKPPPLELPPDAAFQVDPPRVAQASVREVGAASLLEVDLAPEERRIAREFAIVVDETSIALRDDGSAGDERAGDGRFSARIARELATVPAAHEAATRALLERGETVEFDQRVKRVVPVPESLRAVLDHRKLLDLRPIGDPRRIDVGRSLMIVDPHVVEDPSRTFNPCTAAGNPSGVWTFGHLMTELCNQPVSGISPEVFVRKWLRKWELGQTVNDFGAPARTNIRAQIIEPWELASGGPGHALDLTKAPFRLLAIVNRIDLRKNTLYGGNDAGEARFVFCAIDRNCQPLQFTVIFEYGIQRHGCAAIKAWGQQWVDLASHALGSPAYNHALEAITLQFTERNVAPSKPNHSALNQLRTNEIAIGSPWELREFVLAAGGWEAGHLSMDTVKLTPDLSFNNTPLLATFINTSPPSPNVPLEFPAGSPFLGASALTPGGLFWNAPAIAVPEKRFDFSLNTCNGCHAGETATAFTHVKPAPFGSAAGLSAFLTGGPPVPNPTGSGLAHEFADLERRQLDLAQLVSSPCLSILFFRPLPMVH